MNINILVFGQLYDIIHQVELHISDVKDSRELIQKLDKMFPKLAEVKYALAINKKIIHKNTLLNDNDIVALLPPFSGG